MTRTRIRDVFESSAKSWELDKFEMFEKYVKVERDSIVLTTGLAVRRLLTLAALALDGVILYFLTMQYHRNRDEIESVRIVSLRHLVLWLCDSTLFSILNFLQKRSSFLSDYKQHRE